MAHQPSWKWRSIVAYDRFTTADDIEHTHNQAADLIESLAGGGIATSPEIATSIVMLHQALCSERRRLLPGAECLTDGNTVIKLFKRIAGTLEVTSVEV